MGIFGNALRQQGDYLSLRSAVCGGETPCSVSGLSHIHKALTVGTLIEDSGRGALVITADEGDATRLCEDLTAMGLRAVLYPQKDFEFHELSGASHEYEHRRIAALSAMADGQCDVCLCSVAAAVQLTLPRRALAEHTITLEAGGSYDIPSLCARLTAAGYTRAATVDGAGQFALRGGILDIFPTNSDVPVRTEFWGDDIDSLAAFDPITQRRTDPVDRLQIGPACEVLFDSAEVLAERLRAIMPEEGAAADGINKTLERLSGGVMPSSVGKYLPLAYEHAETVLDYAGGRLIFISETAALGERLDAVLGNLREEIAFAFEDGSLCAHLERYTVGKDEFWTAVGRADSVFLDTFGHGSFPVPLKSIHSLSLRQTTQWNGSVAQLVDDIRPLIGMGYSTAVMAGTERAARNLADELCDSRLAAYYSERPDGVRAGCVCVTGGSLSAGFECPMSKFALIVRGQQSAQRSKPRRKKSKNEMINSLDELHRGDYVVHVSHGIGIFDGIERLTVDGVAKDYIKIKYAKTDVLYVPVTQLDLVSKYIGNTETGHVKVNRLGGTEWQKTRSRVRSAVKDIAKELTLLYSQRMNTAGYAFSPDSDLTADFERRFEYDETDDQLRCIDEIKADMERPVPMDRLLCGDVGFGKTEVALRAAFKCIADGKQCAILVPTTILAWQHYQTALRRMEGMAVNVEVLSRYRTPKQQEDILRRIRRGEIDLIIGTHRLISNDIKFRDLGLLIIDEEQRFGVAQKERLKEIKPTVDVLTLSATPIPRTLNMAMSGLRDMSSIDEAPGDRLPVQTYVLQYDRGVILEAIRRELRRGGQVYYLHNRVESIYSVANRLAAELDGCTVGVAHGKMSEEQLSAVWRRLIDGEIDVLVCTTIIETGVDVPNANTLIIEDAYRFGLAQLHQLRGRVGRSSRRAYAYLTYRPGKEMTEIARSRLSAIRDFTEFGSGFKIAMRDLELRGAGNVLGGEQHGHMESVGYDMYIRLLGDAISEEKGEASAAAAECTVDIQIPAHIPESYISDLQSRLGIYRRIADIRSDDDALDVTDELIDRFGEPPAPVSGLIQVALVRNKAAADGITDIEQSGDTLRLYPRSLDMELASRLAEKAGGALSVVPGDERPHYALRLGRGEQPLDALQRIL